MIRRYVEEILSLYNFVDGLVVTDNKGIIKYYTTFRPEINNLKEDEVLGKNILDVYPHLTKETSSIYKVLETKKPIHNQKQNLKTFKGQEIFAVNTTLPIIKDEKLIGAIDVSRYVDPEHQRKNVALTLKERKKTSDRGLYSLEDIKTDNNHMIQIKEKIRRVSKTDSPVMITGETGTGKELVAQSLHFHSNRKKNKFVSQNCAAIPTSLLESILFGTVKGSYTGAENRKGLFEKAKQGTLFLDEINSMELSIQAKLLKAVEENTIRRVGGLKTITTDVRFISALNQNPIKSINNNNLREDLFYRLGVVHIHIPPLRERKDDIKLLLNHFIDKFNKKMEKNIVGVSDEVQKLFNEYHWPGNIRELKNVIEGAFNLTNNNIIEIRDLPGYMTNKENKLYKNSNLGDKSLKEMIEEYEKALVKTAIQKCNNKVQSADLLKISKQLLQYKIEKYNLE